MAFWFGWLTQLSTWLVDCWCHPCYKKDKWQGVEFVTSDINLDLFCSNRESSLAQQNKGFNMRLWLVVPSACADIQFKNETGERTLLGSSTYNLISAPENELSMKGSWGSLTFKLTFKAFCSRPGPFVKAVWVHQKCSKDTRGNGKCCCFLSNFLWKWSALFWSVCFRNLCM